MNEITTFDTETMEWIADRLADLMMGTRTSVEIAGMMFVREFEAIHVEINGQQKGGRYSVENATPTAVAVWAKNKIELHGKATSEDIHA